ncbi:MAG: serine/threonine protein kinase [Planctomycetes bacterium]|nr:serine/threonine protein kinase [Planctomycetota bacterium]
MNTPTRLERALAIYLQSEANGADPAAVLQQHPELRELLEPLLFPEPEAPLGDARSTVFGDFELQRELGRGGMGVVHEALQRSLGRRVALKVLAHDVTTDPTRLARFRREAVTLARLDHPNIVRIYDTGETNGNHWLAMELVPGETLEQRLHELAAQGGHRAGSLREVLQILLLVAEALQHVHSMGILHRDVKPSNVLLGRDGRVLLSDFGLARDDRSPTLTQHGMLAGTPHYLAPEYLTAGTMSPSTDVWALGATLYEAITLRRPFEGATNEVVLHQVIKSDPTDPRRLHRGLHQDLAAITLHALEKAPDQRYATMAEFAADLRAFLDLRPTIARPPTHTQRLRRWIRREPLRALLAGSLVLLVALSTFVLVRLPELRAGERVARAAEYEAAIAEGFVRRGEGNRELGEAAARRALELRPEAGEAIVVAALAKLRFATPDAALQELDRLTAGPHDDDDACQRLRALILGRLGRPAERDAVLAALGKPTTQMGLLLAAGLLVENRTDEDNAKAREIVSLATRLTAPRLLVHCQWAVLAGPEDRQECAEALLRLWPEHAFALHTAASLLQWSDAQRAFQLQQKAVRLGLQDQWAHYNLSMYAYKAGDFTTACTAAKVAMSDPHVTDERRPALMQVFTDKAPELVEWATSEWLRLFPGSHIARREHGKAMSIAGQHERALAELRAVAAEHPDDYQSLFLLSWALQEASLWAESDTVAQQLLRIDPTGRRGHDLRMRALSEQDNKELEMLAELRHWTATVRDDAEAWRELADSLLRSQPASGGSQVLPEALRAALRAVECTQAKDAASLELQRRAHLALGETTAAAEVEERIRALRAASDAR